MQGSFFEEYKYIIVPFFVWFGIQLFKFIYDLVKSKKFNFKRLMQAGGMPSSHSGVVISLTTMIGKNVGINSPLFAVALIFSFIVMYDAAGVRRAAGKQAKLLNKIVETPGLTSLQVSERLVEVLGHTPVQVIVGAAIGVIVGLLV
ncbi:MAG: divergent PAP2 family protein [Clostridia bacterium]|jgi:acid phosphatase family membrane protein YuiD|nr:divergent PAP2 family protein [Clostridia bacterium]